MEKERIDLTGKKFGKLTVLNEDYSGGKAGRIWTCTCECGNTTKATCAALRNGGKKSCGCIQRYDLTGQKINMLTVLKKIKRKDGRHYYECLCECGGKSTAKGSDLRKKKTISCGCYRRITSSINGKNTRKEFGVAAKSRIYERYRTTAIKRKIEFTLSKDMANKLFLRKCYYCNSEPNNKHKDKTYDKFFLYTGIDRIDSSKGYIEDNVVPCCKACNLAKNDTPFEEFVQWAHNLSSNLKKKS